MEDRLKVVKKVHVENRFSLHLSECQGPPGTPAAMEVDKPNGRNVSFHVNGSTSMFNLKRAVDRVTGEVFVETEGFAHNQLPTVTCNTNWEGYDLRVTGLLTPPGQD